MDGWLINIENRLDPDLIDNVQYFLRILTDGMHAAIEDSLVIWYDAVTTEGKLSWQNELNDLNAPFFDACNGIFINYMWDESAPQNARSFLRSRAISSGASDESSSSPPRDRLADVYFGCDVFGRGTAFGGGFNAHLAVDASMSAGASVAIFAPGWVLECCISDNPQEHMFHCVQRSLIAASMRLWDPIHRSYITSMRLLQDKEIARQKSVFPSISAALRGSHRTALPSTAHPSSRAPLSISFTQGCGSAVFVAGQPFRHWTGTSHYLDLRMQDTRWNTRVLYAEDEIQSTQEDIKVQFLLDNSLGYCGSSSLRVTATSTHSTLLGRPAIKPQCELFQAALVKPAAAAAFALSTSDSISFSVIYAVAIGSEVAFRLQFAAAAPEFSASVDSERTAWVAACPPVDVDAWSNADDYAVLETEERVLGECIYSSYECKACAAASSELFGSSQCKALPTPVPRPADARRWIRRTYSVPCALLKEALGLHSRDDGDLLVFIREIKVVGLELSRGRVATQVVDFDAAIDSVSAAVSTYGDAITLGVDMQMTGRPCGIEHVSLECSLNEAKR